MIAIGIGCRRGATSDAIVALIATARAQVAAGDEPVALFTHDRKRDEPGLMAAATVLGLPLRFLSQAALQAVEDRIVTRSLHAAATLGVASVSEAAALAGADPGARLLVPRIVGAGTTCAIAQGNGR